MKAIQGDTGGAAAAIQEITQIIGQINDISGVIASAVEEQSATTGEINSNLTQAVGSVQNISENISGVADAARSTSQDASQTRTASDGLRRLAGDLRELVSNFR